VSFGWRRCAAAATVAVSVAALAVAPAGPAAASRRQGLAVRLVNVDATGIAGNGTSGHASTSLSGDGRFVAFLSDATNLVPGDLNAKRDAFVKDRATGQVERVSVAATGVEADGWTMHVSISADGRYVAFASTATNLVPNDVNNVIDVFVRDRVTRRTTRVSTSATGVQANGASGNPEITTGANGTFIVFDSVATNLTPGDLNASSDVFVKVLATGLVDRVSQSTAGLAANADSINPVISADGRFVAFTSRANNLVAGDLNARWDIFVRNRGNGTTERVSVSTAGVEGDRDAFEPAISASGKAVAYSSKATNLVPGDANLAQDVFVRDRGSATTRRVSVADSGAEGDGHSTDPTISASGQFIAFRTTATNLAPVPTSRAQILVHDLALGQTDLVSARADGTPADHSSWTPAISPDGTTIAFRSEAMNLTPVPSRPQLFVRGTGVGPDPNCDFGESSTVCELRYDDGVGAVSIQWYVDGVHQAALDGQANVVHPCTPGLDVEITVRVADANGPVEAEQTLPCLTDFP
jgi:Tol biopolymer transport system component